jgi:L-rhamnose mutarotase
MEVIHLPRMAFRLRIRPGKEEEYDAAHKNVWPALLAKLKEVGISHYSIFRRDQDLFLFMHVEDFDAAWSALDEDPTNLKWQKEMAALFEPVPGLRPGERFAMMKEVFYLE